MSQEFLGIGKTYWMALIVCLSATVGLLAGKVDVGTWQEMLLGALAVGGFKSAAGKIGEGIAAKGGGK